MILIWLSIDLNHHYNDDLKIIEVNNRYTYFCIKNKIVIECFRADLSYQDGVIGADIFVALPTNIKFDNHIVLYNRPTDAGGYLYTENYSTSLRTIPGISVGLADVNGLYYHKIKINFNNNELSTNEENMWWQFLVIGLKYNP